MTDTSFIHKNSKIHSSCKVGPFCYIGEDVEIAEDCELLSHVVIKGPCKIGPNNKFFQFCTIGEDTPDKKFNVHRGTIQDNSSTTITDNNLFMAYSHVAHDCIVGSDNVFANNCGIAGHVKVGNNVTLGAVSLVHQFCTIGDYAFTGLNSVITMDVPAFVKVASNPAKPVGLNSIGMQRGGISDDEIKLLKKAYRILYRDGNLLKEAISKINELDNNKSILKIFIDSIENSSRGILR